MTNYCPSPGYTWDSGRHYYVWVCGCGPHGMAIHDKRPEHQSPVDTIPEGF